MILSVGLVSGLVSLWLIPIAASLLCAVPLSALSALPVTGRLPRAFTMQSPVTLNEPDIVRAARDRRVGLRALLERPVLPAE